MKQHGTPGPYAVICTGPWDATDLSLGCGKVYLTQEQYVHQMSIPDKTWRCPRCGHEAHWDDDNYERYYNEEDEA